MSHKRSDTVSAPSGILQLRYMLTDGDKVTSQAVVLTEDVASRNGELVAAFNLLRKNVHEAIKKQVVQQVSRQVVGK